MTGGCSRHARWSAFVAPLSRQDLIAKVDQCPSQHVEAVAEPSVSRPPNELLQLSGDLGNCAGSAAAHIRLARS
jgi:hypothetical protein